MKIKFVKGHVVKGDANGRPVYKEGDVVEFVGFVPEGYARKYIDKGLAVEYVAPVAKSVPPPVIEKKPLPVVEKIPADAEAIAPVSFNVSGNTPAPAPKKIGPVSRFK